MVGLCQHMALDETNDVDILLLRRLGVHDTAYSGGFAREAEHTCAEGKPKP
jgi:hypothetical protein